MTPSKAVLAFAAASVAGVIAGQVIGTRSETISLVLTAVSGSLGLFPILKDHLRPGRRHPAKPSAATTVGIEGVDLYWHPLVVVAAVVAALQATERVAAAVAAMALSLGTSAAGLDPDHPALVLAMVNGAGLIALVALAILVVPIAYWAAHRLERRSWAWIGLAIVVNQALSVLMVAVLYPDMASPVTHAGLALLLVPGAAIGTWLGERSKLDYGMSLIYGRLTQRDQLDLLEMARAAGERATD